MYRNNVIRCILETWLKKSGANPEWSRSINPPGDEIRLANSGLTILVLDSTIEDNNPDAILDALEKVCQGRLSKNIKITIKADLSALVE